MAAAIDVGARTDNSILIGTSLDVKPEDITADRKWIEQGGLSREQILRFLTDSQYEPSWRDNADKCVDYYDNKQLDAEMLQLYAERGIPPFVCNLIQPTVNAILGLEAKTRSDAEVTFEDDASEQVAAALNKKMHEAERESFADRACSEAYASQIKAGLGWVEVNDNPNPLQYRYRVRSVHRREIWWDWRVGAGDMGLDQARWLLRKQWYDDDVLEKLLPHLKQYIGSRMAMDGMMAIAERMSEGTNLDFQNEIQAAITLEQAEWRDAERHRSIIYECWYRVWQESFVARLPNDRIVMIDPECVEHMELVAQGVLQPRRALWPRMRQSFWLGPHRFADQWTPLPHQGFPYVPFWGFREDLSSMPYGVIRTMLSPQDEINARRSKMMALMSARRVQVDDDALNLTFNTHKQVAEQASAHDHYIVLNANRKNGQHALQIDNNLDLSAPQLEVLREAKQEIHQTSGVFSEQVGNAPGSRSGYAINSLIEQGNTTLAEINDNYRFARRLVFARLLEHIKRDSTHEHCVPVGEGRAKKVIWLNQRQPDSPAVLNSVQLSTARVALQDVPSSEGYRQQQFLMLAELVKALPPEVQAFVTSFVIEASDYPERKKMAAVLRQKLGIPEPGMEDQQMQLPVEVEQELMQGRQLVAEQQAMLQQQGAELQQLKQGGQLAREQHSMKMDELAMQREIAAAKHGQAMQSIQQQGMLAEQKTAAAMAGPAGAEGGDADVDAQALQLLQELATRVERMEQNQGAKRSIVKDRGDGTYEVLTVPVNGGVPKEKKAKEEATQ